MILGRKSRRLNTYHFIYIYIYNSKIHKYHRRVTQGKKQHVLRFPRTVYRDRSIKTFQSRAVCLSELGFSWSVSSRSDHETEKEENGAVVLSLSGSA